MSNTTTVWGGNPPELGPVAPPASAPKGMTYLGGAPSSYGIWENRTQAPSAPPLTNPVPQAAPTRQAAPINAPVGLIAPGVLANPNAQPPAWSLSPITLMSGHSVLEEDYIHAGYPMR